MITAEKANEITVETLKQRIYEEKELKDIQAIIEKHAKQGAFWVEIEKNISENNIKVLQDLGFVVKNSLSPSHRQSTRISWYLD